MEAQILEGTLAEVQQQLRHLPYAPERRLRVIVEAVAPEAEAKRTRNGITLLPVGDRKRVLTTEYVKELLEAE